MAIRKYLKFVLIENAEEVIRHQFGKSSYECIDLISDRVY